jgi:hypothetical protein
MIDQVAGQGNHQNLFLTVEEAAGARAGGLSENA